MDAIQECVSNRRKMRRRKVRPPVSCETICREIIAGGLRRERRGILSFGISIIFAQGASRKAAARQHISDLFVHRFRFASIHFAVNGSAWIGIRKRLSEELPRWTFARDSLRWWRTICCLSRCECSACGARVLYGIAITKPAYPLRPCAMMAKASLNPFAAPFVPPSFAPVSFNKSNVVPDTPVKEVAKVEPICADAPIASLVESVAEVTLGESPAKVEEAPNTYGQEAKSEQEATPAPAIEPSPVVKSSEHFPGYCVSSKMGPDHFEILAVVGQGAFGKVRMHFAQNTSILPIASAKLESVLVNFRSWCVYICRIC
eukprot:1191765-Prorocentrum_minimum.AAC.4